MVKKGKWGHSVKGTILAIAIALIFVFFVAYAIQTMYPAPEYEDFCGDRESLTPVETASECEAVGGVWNMYEKPTAEREGWCERTCAKEFEDASDIYERNVFFINFPLGVIVLVASLFLTVEVIATSFMAGGTIMVFYGTMRYWGNLSDIWRTIMLGIALVILVWVGYRKFK